MTPGLSHDARRRLLHITAALALGIAGVGFVRGVRETEGGARAATASPATSYAPAPGYEDLRRRQRGPNAHLQTGAFAALSAAPQPSSDVVQTPAEREAALALRKTRRAYDGAPPGVPHDVGQQDAPACLACHEVGARVAGKTAPRMSHERHDSCLQCHVVMRDPRPHAPSVAPPENTFVGADSPTRGERAYDGAPPTIPHTTWMRSECGSCHGIGGLSGMRTPHPYRQSCTQCHTPSATLDQRETAGNAGPVGWAAVP